MGFFVGSLDGSSDTVGVADGEYPLGLPVGSCDG